MIENLKLDFIECVVGKQTNFQSWEKHIIVNP